MRYHSNVNGYQMVGLMDDYGQWTRSVRVLVADTFVEGRDGIFNTPIHRDGDPKNCRADNLLWRPRWFALEWAKQFQIYPQHIWGLGPIRDEDGVLYQTSFDAVAVNGVLLYDLRQGIFDETPVFPIFKRFYFTF